MYVSMDVSTLTCKSLYKGQPGVTFERMNIFTCGKKHMVTWINAVTGGGQGPGQGPNSNKISNSSNNGSIGGTLSD